MLLQSHTSASKHVDNRGEVSQILRTLKSMNFRILIGTIFFDAEKSYLYVILKTFSRIKKYCSYQKLCHLKFATPPHDYTSLCYVLMYYSITVVIEAKESKLPPP